MKAVWCVTLILATGCGKKSEKVSSYQMIEDASTEVPVKQDFDTELEYFKLFRSKFPNNTPFDVIYQGELGRAIFDNIETLTLCDENKFIENYRKAIELDIGALGIEDRVKMNGLYNTLFYTVRTVRTDAIEHSAWQRVSGAKLYNLLLRVDKLPDTVEFSEAKIRIFQGAADMFREYGHYSGKSDSPATDFYHLHRKVALEYFEVFDVSGK